MNSIVVKLKRAAVNRLEYLALVQKSFKITDQFLNQLHGVVSESGLSEWSIIETGEGNILLFAWTDGTGHHQARFDPSAVDRDLLIVEEVLES